MRMMRMVVASASACALVAVGLPAAQAAETTAGNNLSVPLLWSEADYLPPLTIPVTEQFTGEVLPGHLISQDSTSPECMGAVQQDPGNIWQADTALTAGSSVTTIDWGDNLEAMDPNLSRAYTRVEVGLLKSLDETATGYDMCWISGRGSDELWGAQVTGGEGSREPVTSERTEAVVYTAGARLTIQRIVPGRDYSWNATQKRWTGTGADEPYYNGALHEKTSDGPGNFGAEITISGKLSYGFLWSTNAIPTGEYRLTFSLDGPSDAFPGSGTSLAEASVLGSDESMTESALTGRAEGSGNTAVMRGDLNLSYIDVTVGTRTDPIPTDEPTTPPPPSGGSTTPSTPDSTGSPTGNAPGGQGDPGQGAQQGSIAPVAATALMRQRATIRAAKAGTYRVGRTLMLAAKPVTTDAGVTVRWRVRVQDRDECRVQLRDGQATLKLLKPGTCRVIGWAPAPSPEYAPYQWTRTYRIIR